jgi:hypothetical protein
MEDRGISQRRHKDVADQNKVASIRVSDVARRSTLTLDGPINVNTLILIFPYKYQGFWVFDDEKVGLLQEPFVSGADVIIERLAAHIPDAERGFRLLFSASPFPGFTAALEWRRTELGGNWYYSRELDLEGWLCPALFKYFATAPQRIYAKFEARAI